MRREGAAVAPRLVAGALAAGAPLVGALAAGAPLVGAAAPEAAVGVAVAAVVAPRPEVVGEAAASRPADRAAESAHRQ
jgi:hypothetical protein